MGERAGAEPRYTAFLSYSHKDAAAGGRLHRRLEAYRLPKRLAGTATARGIVPDRLWPIFRDREELPAATDLSETVREALAMSGALIVLCSPHAAQSLWVAEEIETFRRLHPDRPILAAVLDGDPPDCFPAALRAFGRDGTWHEPLATDLRPGRDGAHLGLLKLVAGITGVGLDALVQRDAARRIRRVTAVTAAALVVMLIMTALAVIAVQARREADRQRAEVERHIEFMLTDLRTRLEGVGRLDIMDAVNRHALNHYDRQDLAELDPGSLERRARVLQTIGRDDMARGNVDEALAAFGEAFRTTGEQLQRASHDPARIFAHSQNEFWVGQVHERRQNWPEALAHYERYAVASERLVGIAPGNLDYMMEAGYGSLNIGAIQLRGFDRPLIAQRRFARALRWFARVEERRPGNAALQADQANALGWLADSFYEREMLRESRVARRRQYDIYQALLRIDPLNLQNVHRLAIAERSIARLDALLGERAEARTYMIRAYERARRLTDRDGQNANWLLLKTQIECELLNPTLAIDSDLPRDRLRRSIGAAGARLRAQRNPRISELGNCLDPVNDSSGRN